MTGYRVWCEICGREYDERDPEVTLHPGPVWECADEGQCFTRKAMNDLERTV